MISKLFLFTSLFLVLTGFAFSQNKGKEDSLEKVIKNSSDNLEKAKAYVMLSEVLYQENHDTIYPLCSKAVDLLNQLNFSKLSKTKKREYYETSASAYNNIGTFHFFNNRYSEAVQNLLKATKIREKSSNTSSLAESYNNIAFIYKQQDDTINATKYFKKSLQFAEKHKDQKAISLALNGIGSMFSKKDYKEALHYYFRSLEIQKALDNQKEIGVCQHNIGTAYHQGNDNKSAEFWYLKSVETKSKINDEKGTSSTFLALASLKLEEQNIAAAKTYALKAYDLAKELEENNNIAEAAAILHPIFQKEKNYKKALEFYQEEQELRELLRDEANENEVIKLQERYEYDKRAAADSLKSAEEKLQLNYRIKDEKDKQFWFIIFIALTIAFGLLMFNRFKKTSRQKTIIEQKNQELFHKNKEITDSINYAKRIQYAMLANEALIQANIKDYFIHFRPKDIVSGDFYWATKKNNLFYLAVCDSTGHGVPGAFMSLLNISFLNEAVNEMQLTEPHKILNHVRSKLIENLSQDSSQDGMDATLLCFNETNGEISYSAAYNAPIVLKKNGEFVSFECDRMPIGRSPKQDSSFQLFHIKAEKGDMLYVHTDGFPDQFGGTKHKKMKMNLFKEKMMQICSSSLAEQEKELIRYFDEWKGDNEQVDDILVLGVRL